MEKIEEIAEQIINGLDEYARDYDQYEYGLPTHNEHMDNQKRIVIEALTKLKEDKK